MFSVLVTVAFFFLALMIHLLTYRSMDNGFVIHTTSYYYTSSQICEAENDGSNLYLVMQCCAELLSNSGCSPCARSPEGGYRDGEME